ncbi:hypothetical protein Mapa_003984 [Marchantia paleacea]|nr:hypothetical protein Mapa_003984 [Marchantia paleacea]
MKHKTEPAVNSQFHYIPQLNIKLHQRENSTGEDKQRLLCTLSLSIGPILVHSSATSDSSSGNTLGSDCTATNTN